MTLVIEVNFLAHRFAASDGHDGSPPEWPPAPARLFSALVSACEAEVGGALRWLEQQGSPVIHADETQLADPHPMWLVTNSAHTPGGSARHPGRTNVLRSRQRRWLRTPRVVYEWPGARPDDATILALDDAARRVAYLGRPVSPAAVRVGHDPVDVTGLQRWDPGSDGFNTVRLRVPFEGYLDALIAAFEIGGRVDPPYYGDFRPAGVAPGGGPTATIDSSPWRHLLIFHLTEKIHLPGPRLLAVTQAFRAALIDRIGTDVPSVVSGHGTPPPHCAYLALPATGHSKADGHLLGIALAIPDVGGDVQRRIRDALHLDGFDGLAIRLRNVPSAPSLIFHRPTEASGRVARALQPASWQRPSQMWRTVTPAVLDRAPSRSVSQQEAIRITIANAGLPMEDLASVRFSPASFAAGGLHLRPRQTLRRPADRIRPFGHLEVRFSRPVSGPVLVGALRHFGLGLCAPVLNKVDHGR